jgi:hypothetical protein
MYLDHHEGLLSSHAQKFAEAQFGDLEYHPCTPMEDNFLWGAVVLMLAPVVVVIAFMVA